MKGKRQDIRMQLTVFALWRNMHLWVEFNMTVREKRGILSN